VRMGLVRPLNDLVEAGGILDNHNMAEALAIMCDLSKLVCCHCVLWFSLSSCFGNNSDYECSWSATHQSHLPTNGLCSLKEL
jgi:hypothetical protein